MERKAPQSSENYSPLRPAFSWKAITLTSASLRSASLRAGGREPWLRSKPGWIDELGDASVPFAFDLHAMLYSDNAPELETALHRLVQDRQVNLVNARKEFYKDVELSEIEAFVKQRGLSAQFIKIPEAKEYRETLAMRAQQEVAPKTTQTSPGNGTATAPGVADQEPVSV